MAARNKAGRERKEQRETAAINSRTDSVSGCKNNTVFFTIISFVSCYYNKMTLRHCPKPYNILIPRIL